MPYPSLFAPVLVVDDDESIRTVFRLSLEDVGYAVYEADQGTAALRLLRTSVHSMVVLLDLWMPGMGGERVLEAVVADDTLAARHAFVLLTDLPPTRPSLLGALLIRLHVLLLPKPFELDALLETVAWAAARLPVTEERPEWL